MNEQIVNYKLVTGLGDAESLNEEVMKSLTKGWQPFGPPYFTPKEGHCQCMVKYASSENPPVSQHHKTGAHNSPSDDKIPFTPKMKTQ
jgi:hypothetical protein